MDKLIMVAQLLTALSLLVFVHELGHFMAAKAFGMRVNKFFIFFDAWGKKIFSKKIGDTEYGIGILPLGGYVQIAGMIDETQDASTMSAEPEEWEFRAKPAWQRFIVMIGGIVMNVITGFLIFAMYLHTFEREYIPMSEINKDGIFAYPLAQEIGLRTGDKIVAINGNTPDRFKDMASVRLFLGGTLTVERNGQQHKVVIPDDFFKRLKASKKQFIEPMYQDVKIAEVVAGRPAAAAGLQAGDQIVGINEKKIDRFADLVETLDANKNGQVQLSVVRKGSTPIPFTSSVDSAGKLGFVADFAYRYQYTPYSWGSAIRYSFSEGIDQILGQALSIGMLVTGRLPVRESLTSPVGIAKLYGGVWNWDKFWSLTGLLSFALAVMNILPIPALDGGHMVFLGIEMITRRRPSEKMLERAQIVGMILLLALMVFAFGNDIYKSIVGEL